MNSRHVEISKKKKKKKKKILRVSQNVRKIAKIYFVLLCANPQVYFIFGRLWNNLRKIPMKTTSKKIHDLIIKFYNFGYQKLWAHKSEACNFLTYVLVFYQRRSVAVSVPMEQTQVNFPFP